MKIGQRIRALRERRKLTVAELAKRTGYTPGFISQVENDQTNLSINSLLKMTEALGASINAFFDEPKSKNRVVRKKQRGQIVFPQRGIIEYLLSPTLTGHMQIILAEVDHGSTTGPEPYTHDSDEECGIVLKGRIRVWVGGEEYVLEEGDSITFESRIPHRWENIGRGKATVLWAMTPPSWTPTSRSEKGGFTLKKSR